MEESHLLVVIILAKPYINRAFFAHKNQRKPTHPPFLPQGNCFGSYLKEGICFFEFIF